MVLVPLFLSQAWPFHPAGTLVLLAQSLAQGSRSLNARADLGGEPQGTHREAVGSRPLLLPWLPLTQPRVSARCEGRGRHFGHVMVSWPRSWQQGGRERGGNSLGPAPAP